MLSVLSFGLAGPSKCSAKERTRAPSTAALQKERLESHFRQQSAPMTQDEPPDGSAATVVATASAFVPVGTPPGQLPALLLLPSPAAPLSLYAPSYGPNGFDECHPVLVPWPNGKAALFRGSLSLANRPMQAQCCQRRIHPGSRGEIGIARHYECRDYGFEPHREWNHLLFFVRSFEAMRREGRAYVPRNGSISLFVSSSCTFIHCYVH